MKIKPLKIILILAIIAGGYLGMKVLKNTGPESKRRQPQPMQVVVEVQSLRPTQGAVTVEGMGVVKPAREVVLKAQVGGKVNEVSPDLLEGQYVGAGEVLARIEAADYELAVARAESALAMRDSELAIEMGSQRVAKREWELLSETASVGADSSLALREPQLREAQAMQQSARSELEQARLNLDRTQLHAPFNSVVMSKSVELGSLAGANAEVARLVSTDNFYVQVSIPESQVSALSIPGAKASICIRGTDTKIAGEVVSLMSDLDPDGRMARLLVKVKDPLGLLPENASNPKLLLGAYVEVVLTGKPLPGAFEISRSALRNGDVVWLMRDDQTLEIRPVDLAWKNRETVLVTGGVHPGEKLITTSLSFASDGMLVTLAGQKKAKGSGKGKPGEGKGKPKQ